VLFNSFIYILAFLPATIVLTWLARRLGGWRLAQAVILGCSVFFYSYARPLNLVYLAGSILANWLLGRWLAATRDLRRKRVLQLGLALNVGFLGIFKYANFFARSVPWLVHHGWLLPDLEFPLGISFFTISQIMYLVNCYEGAVKPSTLFDHATFVSFFPYVISGPISRAKRIIHQFPVLGERSELGTQEMARGVYLFSMGLFKKVVFADAFSQAADAGFGAVGSLSTFEAWFFVTCYALQIYFDFSGYSDMAIGSALMLGVQVSPNFDAPLQSKSIIEFWQRWHISLTSFITNYMYTPIIRAFPNRTWIVTSSATLVAMTIAGLWHGPNWTFVMFGAIHGIALAVNQNWRTYKMPKLPPFLSWLLTLAVADLAFVFFRSPSLSAAAQYVPRLLDVHHLFGVHTIRVMNGTGFGVPIFVLTQAVGVVVAFYGLGSEARAREFKPAWNTLAATVALTCCAFLFMNSNIAKPFVYFAF
jgi:D-alanyl-lipoteichoic acid acyltransferase DltB (MBOAT superfamily)